MGDYGHDLQFGIFPSPDADRAEQTLELAQLAEVTGLELVSVQDHPYQAKHLDTWTLLSVIAARTTAPPPVALPRGQRPAPHSGPRRPERRHPAASPPGRPGPFGGDPGPAEQR